MMNEFRTAKEAYDQTPIPQELNERVQAGIRQGSAGRTVPDPDGPQL